MTKDEAIKLYDSKFWEDLPHKKRAEFQINEKLLCMPFSVFHEAVEKTINRPVFTHEFGLNWAGLQGEIMEGKEPPTFEEIMALVPKEKQVILVSV